MYKKTISVILIIACLSSLNGCTAAFRKKFIRKKKGEEKPIPVFQPKSYELEFTKEQRYINHYTFWKNAHTEVMSILQEDEMNYRKLKVQGFYTANEIIEMQKLMPQDKQKQIQPYVKELGHISEKLKDSSYVLSHKHTLLKRLKHIYNEVTGNFSYMKMKGFLQQ